MLIAKHAILNKKLKLYIDENNTYEEFIETNDSVKYCENSIIKIYENDYKRAIRITSDIELENPETGELQIYSPGYYVSEKVSTYNVRSRMSDNSLNNTTTNGIINASNTYNLGNGIIISVNGQSTDCVFNLSASANITIADGGELTEIGKKIVDTIQKMADKHQISINDIIENAKLNISTSGKRFSYYDKMSE